jgi:hypothetical protein
VPAIPLVLCSAGTSQLYIFRESPVLLHRLWVWLLLHFLAAILRRRVGSLDIPPATITAITTLSTIPPHRQPERTVPV